MIQEVSLKQCSSFFLSQKKNLHSIQ